MVFICRRQTTDVYCIERWQVHIRVWTNFDNISFVVFRASPVASSDVSQANIQKVFFDLEKAYESTWKFGIMRDLHSAGLRGRLPLFIENFLKNRQFHVRLGSSYSDLFEQEMGIPQGSILSVTLFGLKINSIVKAISPGVECSLYVDDFLICYRSKHVHIIERHLQQCLNKLADWADTNGFNLEWH